MERRTKEDIYRLVEEEDIEFIRLQFTDIFGNLKNVAITPNKLERALNNQFFFDGSSVGGMASVEESDMLLKPDLDTLEIIPWRPQNGRVARMYCDICRPDGSPFEGDSRQLLKKQIEEAAKDGYRFDVGPECEFFMFHSDDYGKPTTLTHELASYYDVGPLDQGENARRDIVLNLEEMGLEVEASHHEMAPAQHEVEFLYDEALKTADNVMTFKITVKTIAKRHGLHATFMPKPRMDFEGSGMHTNMSLSKDGKNIFSDPDDPKGLSREAYYFIGGILKHIKGMTLITNPLVNSYKRLVGGFNAPTGIAWSAKSRSTLIRIPAVKGENTRVELRNPDPSANPYLMLAVLLAAGMDGIRNQIEPPKSVDQNLRALSKEEQSKLGIEQLPATLGEAIEAFEQDVFLHEVLGEFITRRYLELKKKEWNEYNTMVSQWEIDRYLNQY